MSHFSKFTRRRNFVLVAAVLYGVPAYGSAAQTRPTSSVMKSAHAVSGLVQSLILAIFLIVLFIFIVSLLVAIRRIMLARPVGPRVKTTHVDAWKIAGERLKTDADPESPDEFENKP
jgi:uncharacterized membrane protein